MSEYPSSIPGDQLVYSNVEAEFSASNRRGFQVWLVSPKRREQQREIARRLEDYDWPTRDAAANFITERHCFFRTAAGLYVIARTVPLVERDVLNRAGRFHAHAVILSPEHFAQIHYNPFAVWDHFPFQNDPKAAIEQELWKRDDPFGREEIRVGPPRVKPPESDHLLATLLPLLVNWLDQDDDPRPIGVPVVPARFLTLVRSFFALLPGELRQRLSLDSLSTGQSLNTLTYRLAGGYDATTLREWSYRRAYKLDPESGELTPPPELELDPGLNHLANCWIREPDIVEEDRSQSYLLFKGLGRSHTASLPPSVSDVAVRFVSGATNIAQGYAARVNARLQADLTRPGLIELLETTLRERIGPFSSEALALIREPLPIPIIAESLLTAVWSRRLSEAVADDLEQWTAEQLQISHDGELANTLGKLFVIARRWCTNRTTRLRELLLDPYWYGFCEPWFMTWLSDHSPMISQLLDPEQCEKRISDLFRPVLLEEHLIADAELLLAADPEHLPLLPARQLRFVIALHQCDYLGLEDALQEPNQRLPFLSWVFGHLQQYGWHPQFKLQNVDGALHAGALFTPKAGPIAQALNLLDACANENKIRKMLVDWITQSSPPQFHEIYPDMPSQVIARKAYERHNWTKLADTFTAMSPAEFCYAMNGLIGDKVMVHTRHCRLDQGIWVGQQLTSNGLNSELFADVYDTAIRVIQYTPEKAEGFVHALLYGLKTR